MQVELANGVIYGIRQLIELEKLFLAADPTSDAAVSELIDQAGPAGHDAADLDSSAASVDFEPTPEVV